MTTTAFAAELQMATNDQPFNYLNYDNTTGEFVEFFYNDMEKYLNIDDIQIKFDYNNKLHKYKVVNVFNVDKEI